MSFSVPLTTTTIHCGSHNFTTTTFDDQSSIDDIHNQVRFLCHRCLPKVYCLQFYHTQLMKFVSLNQNYLFGQSNIFRSDSFIISHNENRIELWVQNMADEQDALSEFTVDETNTVDAISTQDVPVNTGEKNVNDFSADDLHEVLISNEQETPVMHPNSSQWNSSFPAAISSSDIIVHDVQDLTHGLVTNGLPIHNPSTNDHPQPSITTGATMPSQTNSSIQTGYQLTAATIEIPGGNLPRPYFSRDVKPEQRNIYASDQYNQKDEGRKNGYIARVQGVKGPNQARASVWPQIRIEDIFRNIPNLHLIVYVVSEKSQNGIRLWSIHRDKGFLPKGFTRQTQPVNPIAFEVNSSTLPIEGDFTLELPMTTLWQKLAEHRPLYQLDEQTTLHLHPAQHDPSSPRLLCLLANDHSYFLNTICLSDFIRAKYPPQRSLPTTADTVHTNAKAAKRTRTN